MRVVETAKGSVGVVRHGERLVIYANEGRGWCGVRSRSRGHARDMLFQALGPAAVAALQIEDMR